MHDVLAFWLPTSEPWRSLVLVRKRLQAPTVSAVAGGVAYTDPEVYVPTFFGSCFKAEVSMAQSSEI